MTSIKLIVTGANARAEVDGVLTSGMVGIPVTIEYDSAWDGLTKNLVCRCGEWHGPARGETRTILDVGTSATVAHEVMIAGKNLYLGVEGYNADGTLVIPTRWAECGKIFPGANSDADPSADPTLPVWARLEQRIEDLEENGGSGTSTTISVERFERGDLSGATYSGKSGVMLTKTTTDPATGGMTISTEYLFDGEGIDSASVEMLEPGSEPTAAIQQNLSTGPRVLKLGIPRGKSAYEYAVDGGFEGTEEEFAELMVSGSDYELPVGGSELGGVKNGGNVVINADGTMTAPESAGGGISVTGAAVGQTVKIAAVDENGVPTAWEPSDLPGESEWYTAEYDFSAEPAASVKFELPSANIKEALLTITALHDGSVSGTQTCRIYADIETKSGHADQLFASTMGSLYTAQRTASLHYECLSDALVKVESIPFAGTCNNEMRFLPYTPKAYFYFVPVTDGCMVSGTAKLTYRV